MSERLRGDLEALGDAYHQLFRGEDTDAAEAAAVHMAETFERIRLTLVSK